MPETITASVVTSKRGGPNLDSIKTVEQYETLGPKLEPLTADNVSLSTNEHQTSGDFRQKSSFDYVENLRRHEYNQVKETIMKQF